MYAIKFENIYYEKIWGGRDIENFRNNMPNGNIGESWDVACHPNGNSIVANGEYKGKSLQNLIKEQGEQLLGKSISKDKFPLLLKIINAKENLSLQVHPNDGYAINNEGELGKTEAWYVMEAKEDASLIVGTKDCTREKFIEAIEKGNFDKYINKVAVKKGEVYFVESGLVHGIGKGVTVVEIQQNSDTTYRVYDYNRGRELHIDKALEVIDFSLNGEKSHGIIIKKEGYEKTYFCLSPYFSLEKYDISREVREESDKERFYIFTCVEGQGVIEYNGGKEEILKGDSMFIPATLGKYKIQGNLQLLKTYVPDVKKVQEEIMNTIRK